MTKSDIQRIEEAVNERYAVPDGYGATGFKAGAQYEHDQAYNQAIEDAIKLLSNRNKNEQYLEEIQKLRK